MSAVCVTLCTRTDASNVLSVAIVFNTWFVYGASVLPAHLSSFYWPEPDPLYKYMQIIRETVYRQVAIPNCQYVKYCRCLARKNKRSDRVPCD